MKFQKLARSTEWPNIKKLLLELYPDQESNIDGYEMVYCTVLTLIPIEYDMTVHIVKIVKDYDGSDCDLWHSVHGTNGEMNEHDLTIEQTFALEFTKWEKWANMDIHYMTMEQFSNEEIMVHCLYEMTCCGFDQEQIQEQIDELNRRVDSVKDGTAEFISWEDVKQGLKDKFGWRTDEDDENDEETDE